MKRFVNIAHILIIALWPAVFLLLIGGIEAIFEARFLRTFDIQYAYWRAAVYAFSGCLFAVSGFYDVRSQCKNIVRAHIVSGSLVILFCVLWIFAWAGVTSILATIAGTMVLGLHWGVLGLVLGYTVYTTIRAVVLYRMQS